MRGMDGIFHIAGWYEVGGRDKSNGQRIIAGVTYIVDNNRDRHELGFDPRPLADGLRETLEHEMKLLGMR